ncbi:MAG: hypothetical protein GOVbin4933_38 [Prokaryotic dsDNA virus sp.]|nr:MAG: hypothetical protein GOVbin4933_38 [Prokaryotic dsDNA virus sp.]|tara:strand:+ start:3700 stop:3981 length:282 start_codon:yes stop_codon:yes gene_type:complete
MTEPVTTFPYVVSYGLSRMFRVMHVNVGAYHIEQKVARATETEPAKWQCLAISNHFDASEALGVMHEAQMSYAVEIRARQNAIRKVVPNGLNA